MYSDAMYSICRKFINNAADAEEILQDSFVKAFINLKKLKDNEKFGGWLKRITINECINFLNKKKIIFEEYDTIKDNENSWKESTITDSEVNPEIIKKAAEQLPDGCRIILNLYLLEGLKHKEIAKMLKISESTSKSQYQRAKQLLKMSLTKR